MRRITDTLKTFGIEDMTVVGVLVQQKYSGEVIRERLRTKEMLLSHLCGFSMWAQTFRLPSQPCGHDERLSQAVEKDGQIIGEVDSDGYFHFTGAPDLRTAIGWAIATNLGEACLNGEELYPFDLDRAAQLVFNTIRDGGITEKCFRGPYRALLRRIFVTGKTAHFGGDVFFSQSIWQVATRLLGMKHEGWVG